ncbi:Single tm domain protein [Entamoeba marina]
MSSTGKKKVRIVNGMLVDDDNDSPSQLRSPPPQQPLNLFPRPTTTNPTTPTTEGPAELPLAMPAIFLLLSEALFFDWIVVLVTFIIMLLLLSYLIVKN